MTFLRFVTRFRSVGFFLVVVALCIASQLSMAQTQGRITGRVTDPSGAVIVGAKVTIENVGKIDAVMFLVHPSMRHRVASVTGEHARTAWAGWFRSAPRFGDLLRERLAD